MYIRMGGGVKQRNAVYFFAWEWWKSLKAGKLASRVELQGA